MDVELKPCPCCGAHAEFSQTSLMDTYSDHEVIKCTQCKLQMDDADADAWNRRAAHAPEQGGEMREALERIIDHAEDWHAHYCEMWGERRKEQQDAILGDIMNARALLARETAESAEEHRSTHCRECRNYDGCTRPELVMAFHQCSVFEPAEERGPEVDALLWMAEHLMGSSVAMTMRGWLAEYRAAGKLVVRDADGTVKDSLTVASKERQ